MAASEYISCFLKSVRRRLKDVNERLLLKEKYAAASNMFFYVEDCVTASRNTSIRTMARGTASKASGSQNWGS